MRTSIFSSTVTGRIKANFRTIDKPKVDLIERSLRNHYFAKSPEGYLSSDWGKNDLENHLSRRLDTDRNLIIPWLEEAKPLRDTSILEIGCGTGCSTVALAEQGAKVTAIDVDESSLVVASERCLAYGLDVNFAQANATEVKRLIFRPAFRLHHFLPPQENLWVNFGSGRAPSVWYNATSSP